MSAIEIVHDNNDAENIESDSESQEVNTNTEVPASAPEPDTDWSSLKVKNLTKAQRNKLLQDSENGIENDYFKVQQLKNGTVRIVKRSNPLNVSSGESKISEKFTGKRLTTEQLLLEHVLDLERKYEVMRQKHKKLKKRYNRLENDIMDSDDDGVDEKYLSRPAEPEQLAENFQENPVRVKEPETLPQEPIVTATFRPRNGKPSWRSMITSM